MTDLCNSISYPCWGYRLPILGLQAHYIYICIYIYPFWGCRLFLFVWGDTDYLQFHSISILGMRWCQTILIHLWGIMGYLPFALPIKPGGQPNQWPAAPFLTCAVVMGKKVLKKDIKTKVARVQRELPFQPSPRTFQPRSMKDRQHACVLAGLKYLKAPMVIWLDN